MSYTNLTILSIALTICLDFFLGTKLILQKKYWILVLFVVLMQTIVDNYLNGRWLLESFIVGPYDPKFYSGIKLWHTPLENYFFGIALVTINVIIYEKLKKLNGKSAE